MATPIGHLLAGASIGAAFCVGGNTRRSAVVGALAATAADLDFIPGWLLGDPGRFHHVQSHSFVFAVLAAAIAMLLAREARLRWGLLVGLGYASHLALDLLTLDDSPPQGIPLFWPGLSDVFQSPFTFFSSVPWGSGIVLNAHNVEVVAWEVILLGPLLIGTLLFERRRRREPVP